MARNITQNAKGTDYDDSRTCSDGSGYRDCNALADHGDARPVLTIGGIEHGYHDFPSSAGFGNHIGTGVSHGETGSADQTGWAGVRHHPRSEGVIMTNVLNAADRAKVLNEMIAKVGTARALEAGEPNVTPEPNKWGVVGVDYTGGKFRARIRYCDALTGQDVRITLIRTDSLEEADYAYRAAHVLLWGSASWACDDDFRGLLGLED
jgi:hypothetical protein